MEAAEVRKAGHVFAHSLTILPPTSIRRSTAAINCRAHVAPLPARAPLSLVEHPAPRAVAGGAATVGRLTPSRCSTRRVVTSGFSQIRSTSASPLCFRARPRPRGALAESDDPLGAGHSVGGLRVATASRKRSIHGRASPSRGHGVEARRNSGRVGARSALRYSNGAVSRPRTMRNRTSSRRPSRPLPSRNGWIVSNWTWSSASWTSSGISGSSLANRSQSVSAAASSARRRRHEARALERRTGGPIQFCVVRNTPGDVAPRTPLRTGDASRSNMRCSAEVAKPR